MTVPPRFTVSESSHRIMNPITPERIDEFGRALRLKPGMTMLDLAAGKGETLCQWALQHGITGTGVDLHPPFVAAARARAAELGVGDKVTFVDGDAAGYVADAPVDIVACVGATWIGGGFVGTLQLLEQSLKPCGLLLIGEVYWRELPSAADALEGCQATSVEDFPTQDEIVGLIQGAGYDLVEMVNADEYSWDRYVAPTWWNMREFLDANPDQELAPELRHLLDTEPVNYLRYQRRYLGWGIFALKRR